MPGPNPKEVSWLLLIWPLLFVPPRGDLQALPATVWLLIAWLGAVPICRWHWLKRLVALPTGGSESTSTLSSVLAAFSDSMRKELTCVLLPPVPVCMPLEELLVTPTSPVGAELPVARRKRAGGRTW